MLRSLIHYRAINLAVLAGAAVATAVLSGALLVGDSVRGSLRALTLDRLGRVDHALVGDRFFGAELVDAFVGHPDFAGRAEAAAPAIAIRAAAVHASSRRRASGISVYGVDPRFVEMFPGSELILERGSGQPFPSVVLNTALADELGAAVGDAVLLSVGRFSEVPRDTLMGDKDPSDVVGSVRASVTEILPDRGIGHFSLRPGQQRPLNAYLEPRTIRRALGEDGFNALFVAGEASSSTLDALLAEVVSFEDLGFSVRSNADRLVVESRDFVLRSTEVEQIRGTAEGLAATSQPALSYLANTIRVGKRSLPYSLVVAVDEDAPRWAAFDTLDGEIAAGQLALNLWAARELDARPGDTAEITYFEVGPREELTEVRRELRVGAVVAIDGLAADAALTPEYPGIQDAENMSSWDPPFPVDLDRVEPRDEAYWDEYGALPKAFVPLTTGRELWTTRYGDTTSVRIGPADGLTLGETESRLRDELRAVLDPREYGFRFLPVKADGLAASAGATDFSMLFVAFSFFLILSAALLVGLLFGLGVERRAGEIGLRLAIGYPLRRVRRSLLAEGAVVAGAGGLAGLLLGVAYAAALMAALRTIWLPAVGSSELYLHVRPASLAIGWLAAMIVVLISVWVTLRRLRRLPPPRLLAGSTVTSGGPRQARLSGAIALAGLLLAIGLIGYAVSTGASESVGLAFATGALLLISGLAGFSWWCRGARARGVLHGTLPAMAARNSAWSPGRSILCVALVASACFVIVVVGASRHEFGEELKARDSGSGGFALVAESSVPLHQSLARETDLFDLGFSDDQIELLQASETVALRLLPGEDASCLNLYRPEKPRILGVPPELIERGGFRFRQHVDLPAGESNPWELLNQPLEEGVVPAVGDFNSVMWILHLGLNQELTIEDELGEPLRLRLVGLLDTSIFQSELLISEAAFRRAFPGRTGYSYFLIDTAAERVGEMTEAVESTLSPFGFDATTTREKLTAFKVVENTYMSTFQILGGLGLLLGTVGLGVVLLRNVLERRGELATLRAFGFRRARLAWLVLAETAFLLLTGTAVGTLAALAAVAPRLTTLHAPWGSLGATLALVLVVGMLSCLAAVRGALRIPLLPALKAER